MTMPSMSPSRLLPAAFGALLLAGCGDETVNYLAPDAAPWATRPTRWETPDAGAGGYAFVTNSLASSVSVLDLSARRVVTTVPVGVTPLTENGPHHLAVDLAERAVYMPLSFPPPAIPSGPHAAHGSSLVPGAFIKRSLDDFRLLGRVDVDPNPGDMALTPDGRRAFVTHFDLVRAQQNPGNREMQKSNLRRHRRAHDAAGVHGAALRGGARHDGVARRDDGVLDLLRRRRARRDLPPQRAPRGDARAHPQ